MGQPAQLRDVGFAERPIDRGLQPRDPAEDPKVEARRMNTRGSEY